MYEFANSFAESIFKLRYAFNENETWTEACRRVAIHVAKAEDSSKYEKYIEEFYQVMLDGKFSPGGRIWYGSGRNKPQLLNCFVLASQDSREGWGKLCSDALVISGTGGGIGINYSEVRPRGLPIKGTGGTATGAVSIMRIVNSICEEIKAGGGRRSALMFCLNHDHPDLEEFLDAKLDLKQITNANISVVFMNESPEDFFAKVRADADHDLVWQGKVIKTVKAKQLWNKLVENSLKNGEPGILNGHLANEMNNILYARKLTSTNPCGEIFMAPYGICCLGAVVLSRFVKDSKAKDPRDRFDWEDFHKTISLGIRFLDDVLTVNYYPIPETEEETKLTRRIGLGVMGLHDMLLKLGLKYASEEGRDFVDKIMSFMKNTAYDTSTYLAVEKGPFPLFNAEEFMKSGFVKTLKPSVRNKIKEYGMRNCAVMTIAPTGCQKADTMVVCEEGILELNEVCDLDSDEKWQPISFNVAQDDNDNKEANFGFINGFATTKKITLHSGIELEGTLNHQYRIFEDNQYIWKSIEDLKIGDLLAVKLGGYNKVDEPALNLPKKEEMIALPEKMNPKLAKFLGLYYADGSNHEKGISIAETSTFNKEIESFILDLFDWKVSKDNERGCYINSQTLLEYLKANDLLKQECLNAEIPKVIRMSSKESLLAFLEGYEWGGSRTNDKKAGTRYIDTSSSKMAQQIAVCYRALGQQVKIKKVLAEDKNLIFRIQLNGFDSKHLKETRELTEIVKNFGNDLFFDKIVDLDYHDATTLDITVADTHTYVANSVISHNTTSIVQGVSSGIEPIFSMAYNRRYKDEDLDTHSEVVVHYLFESFVKNDLDVSHFEGSDDIAPDDHFAMQVICQMHVDNAISKTVNLPQNKYDAEKLSELFMKYAPYLKGTTIYPVGSRENTPLDPISIDEAKKFILNGHAKVQEEDLEVCVSGICGL